MISRDRIFNDARPTERDYADRALRFVDDLVEPKDR